MAARSLNKVMLMGHAGKDTEIRYTSSGMAVATFSLATNDRRKDKTSGEWVDHTEWHNIVAWDKLAETCNQYVKKGKQVYIEGRIQTRAWDDKDGNKRYTTEIVANDLILLGGGQGQQGGGSAPSYPASAPASRPATTAPMPDYEPSAAPVDDLPF